MVSSETKPKRLGRGPCESEAPTEPKCAAISLRGPQYATRPPESTSTLWKPANTTAEGWWIVQTTAARRERATRASRVRIAAAAAESRPLVGSSSTMRLGCFTSATASERRRLCPPDRPLNRNPPAMVSAQEVSPVTLRSSSTSLSRAAFVARSERYILNATTFAGETSSAQLSSRARRWHPREVSASSSCR